MPRPHKYPKEEIEQLKAKGWSQSKIYRYLRKKYKEVSHGSEEGGNNNSDMVENQSDKSESKNMVEVQGDGTETSESPPNEKEIEKNSKEVSPEPEDVGFIRGSIDLGNAPDPMGQGNPVVVEIPEEIPEKKEEEAEKAEEEAVITVDNDITLVEVFVEHLHLVILFLIETAWGIVLEDSDYIDRFNQKVIPLWKKLLDKYGWELTDLTEIMLVAMYANFIMYIRKHGKHKNERRKPEEENRQNSEPVISPQPDLNEILTQYNE